MTSPSRKFKTAAEKPPTPGMMCNAIASRRVESLKYLLEQGGDVNGVEDGSSLLIWAVIYNQLGMARLLIDRGADLNKKDTAPDSRYNGNTALIYAARQGYEEIARLLIDSGASLEEVSTHGSTALGLARLNSYSKIAQMIEAAIAEKTKVMALQRQKTLRAAVELQRDLPCRKSPFKKKTV